MARFATAAIVASGAIGPCHRPPIIARMSDSDRALLGGQTASRFLRQHWQKHALLVRSAMPGFSGMFDRASLVALATRDDVESRLVVSERGTLHARARTVPARRLQGAAARATGRCSCRASTCTRTRRDALLRRFSFLPYARLDDLMVSYAAPGGGVGPHFDSATTCSCCRASAGAAGATAAQHDLSLRPGSAAEDPAHVHARARRRARARRHAVPAAAVRARRRRARRVHDLFDRLSRRSAQELAAAFLDFLRDAIDRRGPLRRPRSRARRTSPRESAVACNAARPTC